MNSNLQNIDLDEDFEETNLISIREITWEIRNFESLPSQENSSINSPFFHFENAFWCLRLYPHAEGNHVGFRIQRLGSHVETQHVIYYNLICLDECHGYHSKPDYFDDVFTKEIRNMWLFKRSRPGRRTSGIDETESLTLKCQLSCFKSPFVDAFSQTEQDRKISDVGDLCQNLKNLLLNGQDHDMVLKVKDKEFRVHQNILRARSPVWESMLSRNNIEKNSGVIDIPDCDPRSFEHFLLYIYSGKLETLNADNMLALYYVACKYDMRHLKEQCRQFIENSLTSTTVSDVIKLAQNHRDAVLLECATAYFLKRVSVALHTMEWQSFAKYDLRTTDNFKAGKNSNPENKKNAENFTQIHLISPREITWRVRNLKFFPKAVDFSLDSPTFDFENATWCLRLYPHSKGTHIGFTIVRLRSRMHHHILRYNLIYPAECHMYHSKSDYFDEKYNENGDMLFFERSRSASRYTSGIDDAEILTLKCQLFSFRSPVADAFSQTEQHRENLCQNFKNLLLNGQDHDLVLKVKDKEFRAHQNILRARSPVLESMLTRDLIEKNNGIIDVPDCDPGAFERFLVYLYSEEVEMLDTGNMLTLYCIADKYDVGHLKNQCCQVIKNMLTSFNVSDVLQLALKHSDVVPECVTDYFVQNVSVVLRTVEWQSFVNLNPTQANKLFIKAADKWDAENKQCLLPIASD